MPTWREEIQAAFIALGGRVTYAQLYTYIEENTSRELTREWKSTVRQVVETFGSGSFSMLNREVTWWQCYILN